MEQPEAAAPAEAPTLAAVVAKTLALCGRTPGMSWAFVDANSIDYGGVMYRSLAFRIFIGGLNWADSLVVPTRESEGPEFEAALALMAERVYAGAAAELANRIEG